MQLCTGPAQRQVWHVVLYEVPERSAPLNKTGRGQKQDSKVPQNITIISGAVNLRRTLLHNADVVVQIHTAAQR